MATVTVQATTHLPAFHRIVLGKQVSWAQVTWAFPLNLAGSNWSKGSGLRGRIGPLTPDPWTPETTNDRRESVCCLRAPR